MNVGTLGGYIQWKYGPVFPWIVALWSILALSGTLADRGPPWQPRIRRRCAIREAAHRAREAGRAPDGADAGVVIFAIAASVVGAVFGTLPGDEIPVEAAVGFAVWLGLMALAFGGLAFALAPFLGRGAGGRDRRWPAVRAATS